MDEMGPGANRWISSVRDGRAKGFLRRLVVCIALTVVCLGSVLLLTRGTSYPGVVQVPPDGNPVISPDNNGSPQIDGASGRPAHQQSPGGLAKVRDYRWLAQLDESNELANRIQPPAGYARLAGQPGGFASWLQHLPLKPGQPKMHLYNGALKVNQGAHYAVIDMDCGTRDLQQCAGSIIRLRAEYLYAAGLSAAIQFNFTSGSPASWSNWSAGQRPKVAGSTVTWRKTANPDDSYANFRKYLDTVFKYVGTLALSRQLQSVRLRDMQVGDVFITAGSPGHAVIVIDQAVNSQGKKVFLLAQGFMPAQEMHVLKNPAAALSPWYDGDIASRLVTPEWTFNTDNLKRFKQ